VAILSSAAETSNLSPARVTEETNPREEVKVGPWAVHYTSKGIAIDREMAEGARRHSGGVHYTLEDTGYGKLHILIAPEPTQASDEPSPPEAVATLAGDGQVEAQPPADEVKP